MCRNNIEKNINRLLPLKKLNPEDVKIEIKISLLILTSLVVSCAQKSSQHLEYIDKDFPSVEPKVFARHFITKDSISEFGSVFNEEGNEFFFAIDSGGRAKIKYTTIQKGEWIEPITIISDSIYSFNDPFLSPDESRLYYISDLPRTEQDTIKDHDIWYSEKRGSEWSAPLNAGPNINSDGNEYYMSFTNDGSMYFATNKENYKDRKRDFDIYKSTWNGAEFLEPIRLSDSINTKRYEADVLVSPDESYIIYCSIRKSGLGIGDLYISFKNDKGEWTEAVNMGSPINTEGHELCPFVTKDGKYLFYTSNQDIYWVSTEIFKSRREDSE